MPQRATIRFDADDIADISEQLVEINRNFYTRPTTKSCGSLRFAVPAAICAELGLKTGDECYYYQYSEGFLISFKHKPVAATKAQLRSRKLATAGAGNTLYLAIPPMVKNQYREPITNIKLFRTKGFQPYEWQIQFLSIECT